MNEKQNLLNQIKHENFIWIIYIGIIALCLYGNSLEKKYVLFNDYYSKEKYRKITIFIFSIALIVYLYFFIDGYKSITSLSAFDSKKKKDLNYLSFFSSTLILISGVVFLYIAIVDTDLDVELAFS